MNILFIINMYQRLRVTETVFKNLLLLKQQFANKVSINVLKIVVVFSRTNIFT